MFSSSHAFLATLLLTMHVPLAPALTVDSTSDSPTIKSAVKQIAEEMMGYYIGNQPGQTPGYLPGDGQVGGYYWWVGGGMFGTMVNYWRLTGDATWNEEVSQAIYFQSDPSSGGYFDSQNVSAQLGNDDQSFWAFAALEAAEYRFPNPPSNYPSWIAMAQGVFNQQVQRWDEQYCGGGLRWQVFPIESGWNYKNSISNGCFFNVGARLGKYTGNDTYIDWAIKTYDWSIQSGLVSSDYVIVDGITVPGCSDSGHGERWTYNVGVYLYGAAVMWNITQTNPKYASQASLWEARVNGLIQGADVFFKAGSGGSVLTEVICEPYDTCQVDQSTFKAYLARWMRVTTQVAPFTAATIYGMLADSVAAAGISCSGPPLNGASGVACGQEWYTGSFDGRTGIGMQMNALEVIQTLLVAPGPFTAKDGGISDPDGNAGSNAIGTVSETGQNPVITVTTADKAGAAILTILFTCVTLLTGWWISK